MCTLRAPPGTVSVDNVAGNDSVLKSGGKILSPVFDENTWKPSGEPISTPFALTDTYESPASISTSPEMLATSRCMRSAHC